MIPARCRVARSPWSRRGRGLAFVVVLFAVSPAFAQNVTEPSLKSAFMYNVAKFTEWPLDALPANAPFLACVLGNTSVGDALERIVKGRTLSGHTVSVARMTATGPLRSCHLLYVSGIAGEQAQRIVTTLRGLPVLTIVDIEGFAMPGAIAHMFLENANVRFDLDHGLAKRSRLLLSSKLLSLASHVVDEASVVTR
jgi:hypothetical protein